VIARAVHTMAHLHGPDRVSLSLAPDLPEVRGGDELATVLSNLLDNALLASAPGEVVHLVASADDEAVRIEVVDDGHGMDEVTAARAFELFFSTRGAQGGSGVGLALCRTIVENLGGSIEIRSRPEKGTRVRVRLPLGVSA
jgi:two-component system sensor histidine kinase RegB